MKYQTMRIDHLKHLNIEALVGNVELTVSGETLTIKPLAQKKKPRTKVDLKLANYATVSSAIKAHEDGVEFVRVLPDGDTEVLSWFGLCECYANGYKIRVKEEVEMTELDCFIQDCRNSTMVQDDVVAMSLFEAGCRFVN